MLKTDYKDDLFEGERKYNMTTDTEGKTTLKDVTEYTQKGTSFGALEQYQYGGKQAVWGEISDADGGRMDKHTAVCTDDQG